MLTITPTVKHIILLQIYRNVQYCLHNSWYEHWLIHITNFVANLSGEHYFEKNITVNSSTNPFSVPFPSPTLLFSSIHTRQMVHVLRYEWSDSSWCMLTPMICEMSFLIFGIWTNGSIIVTKIKSNVPAIMNTRVSSLVDIKVIRAIQHVFNTCWFSQSDT